MKAVPFPKSKALRTTVSLILVDRYLDGDETISKNFYDHNGTLCTLYEA